MHLSRPTLGTAAFVRLLNAGRKEPAKSPDPRVRVVPSPDGIITVLGVTSGGAWVAEYRCLTEDFDERTVLAMERRVMEKERQLLRLVR